MILEASFATSVKEKQDISILFKKFSLVVFRYSPDNSDLSEKAIACTTKSNLPHLFFISSNSFTISLLSSTLQLKVIFDFNDSAKGTDVVKEGDEVSVKVIGVDRGKVKLSIKQAVA